ncbi:outer membrane beta-barrel protein [Dyadobacter diqingensis]|uniref:outer membrane beta-barrel protein n=1 Tax=Dyadobacter diqingensis TaxID=2938121 RepID=UPI0020C1AFEE|nr:outer membrane beta-barrel protein [Dyadobacter diqingensis]
MNRFISKMILMAAVTYPCLAQDKGRSEISASYSILPSENTFGNIWLGFSDKGPHGNRDLTLRRGAFFAGYKYFVTDRIAVGAATGFNGHAHESNFRYTDFTGLEAQTLTVAGEVTWIYLKRPAIKLYATAGLGFYTMRASVDSYHSATTTNGATAQITPIGIRFGKKLGVFTELGYGYKGILNTGFSIKF